MALDTLAGLREALSDYLVGHLLDHRLDDFVRLAEAEIDRNLRARQMLRRSVAPIAAPYVSLPADYLEARNVTLSASPGTALRPVSPDEADHLRAARRGGRASFFCVSGGQMEILPGPSGSPVVEMLYYARLPPLALNGTNWLLRERPDLYLNASLAQAAPFVADLQRGAFWRAEAGRIVAEMNAESANANYGASPLVARPRRSF